MLRTIPHQLRKTTPLASDLLSVPPADTKCRIEMRNYLPPKLGMTIMGRGIMLDSSLEKMLAHVGATLHECQEDRKRLAGT